MTIDELNIEIDFCRDNKSLLEKKLSEIESELIVIESQIKFLKELKDHKLYYEAEK